MEGWLELHLMRLFSNAVRRNLATLIVGPLAMVPMVWLAVFISALATDEPASQGAALGLFMALVGLVFAYPATLLIGIPAFIVLERLNKLNLLNLSLVGGISAVLFAQLLPASIVTVSLFIYSALSVSSGCWLVNRSIHQKQLLNQTAK